MSHEGVADSLGPGADQVSAVPRLLEKVAALENSSFRSALGLPPKEKLDSPSAFKAALPILGISSEPTWTLKQTVDAIIAELELQVPTPATEKETSPAQLSMVSSSPSISTSDGVQVPKATSNKYRKAALAAEVRARSSSSKTQVTRTGARSDEPPWVSSSRSRSWGDDAHLDATVDGAHTTITRNTNGSRTASEARAAVDNLASLVTSLQGNCINTAPINRIASKASSTEDDLASLVSSSCAITTAGATATGTGSNISVVSGTGTGNPPYHLSKQQESTPGVPGQVSTVNYQAITKMPEYQQKSFDELRYEHHMKGNKRSNPAQPAAAGCTADQAANPMYYVPACSSASIPDAATKPVPAAAAIPPISSSRLGLGAHRNSSAPTSAARSFAPSFPPGRKFSGGALFSSTGLSDLRDNVDDLAYEIDRAADNVSYGDFSVGSIRASELPLRQEEIEDALRDIQYRNEDLQDRLDDLEFEENLSDGDEDDQFDRELRRQELEDEQDDLSYDFDRFVDEHDLY